jgi:signal peptidase I
MKKIFLILTFCLFCTPCFSQKTYSSIEIITFQSKLKSYYKNGTIDDFGQEIQIAFFKDLILYRTSTIHFEPQHHYINFDATKDGDTIKMEDPGPSIIDKITYTYHIYKKGKNTGLSFGDTYSKGKPFVPDTLFHHTNISTAHQDATGMDFGQPQQVVNSQGKVMLEKFYNLDTAKKMPDSVFRYYDKSLKDFNFSLSPKLDREKQSKLIKSIYVFKYANKLQENGYPYKLEMLDEFHLITKTCTKREIEIT